MGIVVQQSLHNDIRYLTLSILLVSKQKNSETQMRFTVASVFYSTVTDFAKLRGLSTSAPRCNAA